MLICLFLWLMLLQHTKDLVLMDGFINQITYLGSVFLVVTSRKLNPTRHLHLLPLDPLPDGTTRAPRRQRSPKITRGSISTWRPSTRIVSSPGSWGRGLRAAPPLRSDLGREVYWQGSVKTEDPWLGPPLLPVPRVPPKRGSWRSSRPRSRRSARI